MKKYSKLIVAAIVALIFIGTFVFLYEKSQPKPVEYTEFTPKMADVLKTTVITGKIEPRNEVSVKPQISGIITEICKEAGDYVQAGEVIAKVKVIPDMGQLSSAQARVRLAEIFRSLVNSPPMGRGSVINGFPPETSVYPPWHRCSSFAAASISSSLSPTRIRLWESWAMVDPMAPPRSPMPETIPTAT